MSADTAYGSGVFSQDAYGSDLRTPQTAQWAQGLHYDVFGSPDDAGLPSLTEPRFGYRGELSVGDYSVYLRGRWYQPQLGRFTARDPVSTLVGQTRPDSPYPYADNDPLDRVDPLGSSDLFDFIGQRELGQPVQGRPVGAVPAGHRHRMWGVGLPPGHVYFTDDGDRVPAAARAKADQNEDNGNNEAQEGPPCLWCDPIPGVPEVPEIPVV